MPEQGVLNGQNNACKFCKIVRRETESQLVYEDDASLAFLDYKPLFPGHVLLVPKSHYETLADIPSSIMQQLFLNLQLIARAVESGLQAEGSFIAMNNRISKSVPHAHIHVVPRRKGDGLKGFFGPRHAYKDVTEMVRARNAIRLAIEDLQPANS